MLGIPEHDHIASSECAVVPAQMEKQLLEQTLQQVLEFPPPPAVAAAAGTPANGAPAGASEESRPAPSGGANGAPDNQPPVVRSSTLPHCMQLQPDPVTFSHALIGKPPCVSPTPMDRNKQFRAGRGLTSITNSVNQLASYEGVGGCMAKQ